eukprot:2145863-Rhodomonas_salina.6
MLETFNAHAASNSFFNFSAPTTPGPPGPSASSQPQRALQFVDVDGRVTTTTTRRKGAGRCCARV